MSGLPEGYAIIEHEEGSGIWAISTPDRDYLPPAFTSREDAVAWVNGNEFEQSAREQEERIEQIIEGQRWEDRFGADYDPWDAAVRHEKATLTPEQNADEAAQRGNYSVWDELSKGSAEPQIPERQSISIHESSFGVVARENFPEGRSYAHLADGSWARSEGNTEPFRGVGKHDVPERFKDAVETHEIKALDALLSRDIVVRERSVGHEQEITR